MTTQERGFLVLLVLAALALLYVLSPFLYVSVLAAVVATVLWPLHRRLMPRLGGRRWVSAMLLMLLVTVLALLPLTWLSARVVKEAGQGLNELAKTLQSDGSSTLVQQAEMAYELARDNLLSGLMPPVDEAKGRVIEGLRSMVFDATRSAPASVGGVVSGLWRLSVDLVAFAVSLYLFFTTGPELLTGLRRVAPVPDRYVLRLYEVFSQLARNIVVGMVGAGIAQGVVAAIGFAIVGLPAVVVLGTATAATSMVPVVGSMVVWLPVCGGLLANGRTGAAVFVAVWSLALTASADNVVKPFLLKNQLQVSPLWMLLALLGGLTTMGAKGLVFGPLLLVLYLTLYTIYVRDFIGDGPATDPVDG